MGSTNGAVSLGLLIRDPESDLNKPVPKMIPIIIQFGHYHARNTRDKAREQKLKGYENPKPLDIGEIIVVHELMWLNPAPNYGFSDDPKDFGDGKTALRGQAIAIKYHREKGLTPIHDGENTPILEDGFEAKNDIYIVTHASVKTKPTKDSRGNKLLSYQNITAMLAASTFPDGIKLSDRRLTPILDTVPRRGTPLMLRTVTIEPNVATLFGTELFAPMLDYPSKKPVNDRYIMRMYETIPTPNMERYPRENEVFWQQEPDAQAFMNKWEHFLPFSGSSTLNFVLPNN